MLNRSSGYQTAAGDMLAAPWSDANNSASSENFITLFSIDPLTHDLNPPAGSLFPASGAGQGAIFTPSGEFLITAQDNGVGVYKVGHDSLTEVSGSPFGEVGMDRVMLATLGRLWWQAVAKPEKYSCSFSTVRRDYLPWRPDLRHRRPAGAQHTRQAPK